MKAIFCAEWLEVVAIGMAVLDLSGKLLINSYGEKIDLTKIKQGIYLVKLNDTIYKIVKK